MAQNSTPLHAKRRGGPCTTLGHKQRYKYTGHKVEPNAYKEQPERNECAQNEQYDSESSAENEQYDCEHITIYLGKRVLLVFTPDM